MSKMLMIINFVILMQCTISRCYTTPTIASTTTTSTSFPFLSSTSSSVSTTIKPINTANTITSSLSINETMAFPFEFEKNSSLLLLPIMDESKTAIQSIDLQCLSELPVEQLLKIKKSIKKITADDAIVNDNVVQLNRMGRDPFSSLSDGDGYIFDEERNETITALPFMGGDHIKDKSGHGQEIWIEEKQSKVQKIFQISVTALSFLAFGGYLLCMIVQAIKSKGTTYYYPALMPMTSAMQPSTTYKKRRPYHRPKRSSNTEKTDSKNRQPIDDPSPNDLYKILVQAAEGYVKLNENINFLN